MKELRISMVLNILRTIQELEKTWKEEGQETIKFQVNDDKILIESPNRNYRRSLEELLEYQIGMATYTVSNYDLEIQFY